MRKNDIPTPHKVKKPYLQIIIHYTLIILTCLVLAFSVLAGNNLIDSYTSWKKACEAGTGPCDPPLHTISYARSHMMAMELTIPSATLLYLLCTPFLTSPIKAIPYLQLGLDITVALAWIITTTIWSECDLVLEVTGAFGICGHQPIFTRVQIIRFSLAMAVLVLLLFVVAREAAQVQEVRWVWGKLLVWGGGWRRGKWVRIGGGKGEEVEVELEEGGRSELETVETVERRRKLGVGRERVEPREGRVDGKGRGDVS